MSLKILLSAVVTVISFTLLTGFRLADDDRIFEKANQPMPMNADISAEPVKLPSSRDLASDCITVFVNGEEIIICYP